MTRLLLLTYVASVASASAFEIPQNYSLQRYSHLHQNSIVTDDPPPPEVAEVNNDLQDWVLVSTRKSPYGRTVTILNTKDQTQKVRIPSATADELGFSILDVKQDPGNFTKTEVQLKKGAFTGWVKYDNQFLTLKKSALPAQRGNNNRNANQNRGNNRNGRPNNNNANRNNQNRNPNNRNNPNPNPNANRGVPPIPGLQQAAGRNTNSAQGGNKRPARVRYVPRPRKKK